MTTPVISPKKLIEVALPLDAINAAAAREKSIRHGHPSTLHLWWARRPLAAARAVIFAQLVNDPADLWRARNPGKEPNPQEKGHWTKARAKLFTIIEDLVKWENTTNEDVLKPARDEIRKSWRDVCELNKNHPQAKELFDPEKMPGLHDPFAGGGTIPLEAQRLGLEAFASDLNPVAVLINKAMIEIPPKFAGRPPVNPESRREKSLVSGEWKGAQGLAEDVRYYGAWIRDEAKKRIGHLYPLVEVTKEMATDRPDLKPYIGQKLTVIAWLWARTVKSPNPAFAHVDVPLASTFILASKEGKEAYVQPIIEGDNYRFTVKVNKPSESAKGGTTAGKRAAFRCLMSGVPIDYKHIRREAKAGRMGQKLMVTVAEGNRGRVYLEPTALMEITAASAAPEWKPEIEISHWPGRTNVVEYGLTQFGDLFTSRQLTALVTFSRLVSEARDKVLQDSLLSGLINDNLTLEAEGKGALAYAEAISAYLGIGVSRFANPSSTICAWNPGKGKEDIRYTFARQSLPMTWDFAEGNPFSQSSGNFGDSFDTWLYKSLSFLPLNGVGHATQLDAQVQVASTNCFVSTDPPYYDNISYADLADFFYVWLRRSLREVFPTLLATIAVPKSEELVAQPYRHGGKDNAEKFFLDGMTRAMQNLAERAHCSAPLTIYYAFKQSESEEEGGTNSTGWETFLEAVHRAGLSARPTRT